MSEINAWHEVAWPILPGDSGARSITAPGEIYQSESMLAAKAGALPATQVLATLSMATWGQLLMLPSSKGRALGVVRMDGAIAHPDLLRTRNLRFAWITLGLAVAFGGVSAVTDAHEGNFADFVLLGLGGLLGGIITRGGMGLYARGLRQVTGRQLGIGLAMRPLDVLVGALIGHIGNGLGNTATSVVYGGERVQQTFLANFGSGEAWVWGSIELGAFHYGKGMVGELLPKQTYIGLTWFFGSFGSILCAEILRLMWDTKGAESADGKDLLSKLLRKTLTRTYQLSASSLGDGAWHKGVALIPHLASEPQIISLERRPVRGGHRHHSRLTAPRCGTCHRQKIGLPLVPVRAFSRPRRPHLQSVDEVVRIQERFREALGKKAQTARQQLLSELLANERTDSLLQCGIVPEPRYWTILGRWFRAVSRDELYDAEGRLVDLQEPRPQIFFVGLAEAIIAETSRRIPGEVAQYHRTKETDRFSAAQAVDNLTQALVVQRRALEVIFTTIELERNIRATIPVIGTTLSEVVPLMQDCGLDSPLGPQRAIPLARALGLYAGEVGDFATAQHLGEGDLAHEFLPVRTRCDQATGQAVHILATWLPAGPGSPSSRNTDIVDTLVAIARYNQLAGDALALSFDRRPIHLTQQEMIKLLEACRAHDDTEGALMLLMNRNPDMLSLVLHLAESRPEALRMTVRYAEMIPLNHWVVGSRAKVDLFGVAKRLGECTTAPIRTTGDRVTLGRPFVVKFLRNDPARKLAADVAQIIKGREQPGGESKMDRIRILISEYFTDRAAAIQELRESESEGGWEARCQKEGTVRSLVETLLLDCRRISFLSDWLLGLRTSSGGQLDSELAVCLWSYADWNWELMRTHVELTRARPDLFKT